MLVQIKLRYTEARLSLEVNGSYVPYTILNTSLDNATKKMGVGINITL